MDSIFRFFRKLGILLRREQFSSGLEEEMAFHHEQREKELRAEGMSGRIGALCRDPRIRQRSAAERAEPRDSRFSV